MRIAILGGGQLGRMMALAGLPLGCSFKFLDPADDPPAAAIAPLLSRPFDDEEALAEIGDWADVVTWDFENVPAAALHALAPRVASWPPPRSLEVSQDRWAEKRFFMERGIEVAAVAVVDEEADLSTAADQVGLPAILKTRRLGYDGKGQALVRRREELPDAWRRLGGGAAILEAFVDFDRELSVLVVRGQDGEIRTWPLSENRHEAGILRQSRAPAPAVPAELAATAAGIGARVAEDLGHVGVLAVELFQVGDRLLANEMAARVHNSGHWTIEGAATSQFENHVRAIVGWPLGETSPLATCVMINFIGGTPSPAAVLAVPGAHLHLYGKRPRPERKLGHVTLCADDAALLPERVRAIEELMAAATVAAS